MYKEKPVRATIPAASKALEECIMNHAIAGNHNINSNSLTNATIDNHMFQTGNISINQLPCEILLLCMQIIQQLIQDRQQPQQRIIILP